MGDPIRTSSLPDPRARVKVSTPTTAQGWEAEVNRWEWTFARTMPHIPHWYVVRGRTLDDVLFDAFAALIADNGFQGIWTSPSGYRRRNVYLALGEWQYWRIEHIINRDVMASSNVETV